MSDADVCGVETSKVNEWRLPSLIYFLTKNRGKYKLPKYRLQDLYYALKSEDGIAYCDIFARILRQIRQASDDSPPRIDTISEAVENFLSVKRTKSHLNLQKLIANRKMSEMNPETRARVASAFIDLLEEEYIDMDVRFKDNAEETLINAGCDRLGNEYFYIIDDERLYMKGKSNRDVTLVVPPDLKYWDQFLRRFLDSDDDNERLLYTMIGENIVPVLRYTLTDYTQAFHRPNQDLAPTTLRSNEEVELRRIAVEQAAQTSRRAQAGTPTLGGVAGPASAASDPPGSVKAEACDPSPLHSNHAAAPTSQAAPVPKYEVDTPGSVGPPNGAGHCNNPMSMNSAVGSVPPPATEMVHTPATPNPCTNGGPIPPHSNPSSVPTPLNCPVSSPLVGGPASVPSNRQPQTASSLFAANGPRSDPPASAFGSHGTAATASIAASSSQAHLPSYASPPASAAALSSAPSASVTNSCSVGGLDPSVPGSQQPSSASSALPEVFAMYPPAPACSEPCQNFGPSLNSSCSGPLPPHHPGGHGPPPPAKLIFTCAMMAEAAKAKSAMGVPPVQYHSNHALVRQFQEREAMQSHQQGLQMFGPDPGLGHAPALASSGPLAGGIKGPNENLTPEQLEKRRAKMAQIYQIRERCNLAPENGPGAMNGPGPGGMPAGHPSARSGPLPPHSINNCCPNSLGHPHQSNEEAQREWQKLLIQHQEEKIRQQQHMMASAVKGGGARGGGGPGGGPGGHMGPQGGPVFLNQMGPGQGMPMGAQVGPPPPPHPGEMIPPGFGPMGPPPEMMGPGPPFYRPPQGMGAPPARRIPYHPGPGHPPFSPGHMGPMMHPMEPPVAGQKRPYPLGAPWTGQPMPGRPEMLPQRMAYDPMAGMVDMASGKPPTNATTATPNAPPTTGGGANSGGGGGGTGGGGSGGGSSNSKRRKTAKNAAANANQPTATCTSMTTTTNTATTAMPTGPPPPEAGVKAPTSCASTPASQPGPDPHMQAAPSPSHGQYLNPYDGELTITRHVNSAYQEMNDKHPGSAPPPGVVPPPPGNPANGTIVPQGGVGPDPAAKPNGAGVNCSSGGVGPCPPNTQNLTSASLASLARLSNQMPGGAGSTGPASGPNSAGRQVKSDPEVMSQHHHVGSPYIDVSRPNVMDYNRPGPPNNSYMHPTQFYPPPPQHHLNHMPKEEGAPPPPPPPPQMAQEPPQAQPQPPPGPGTTHLMGPNPNNAYRPPHPASNGAQPLPQGPSPAASQQQQQLGNANVQVQAKAPNTIQYIPSEPPTAQPSQRGPPRMPPGMYDYLSVNGVDNGPPPPNSQPYHPGPVVSIHGPHDNVRPHLGAPAGYYPGSQGMPEVSMQRPSGPNLRPPHPMDMGPHAGHSGPYGPGQPPGDPFSGQPSGPRPHMGPSGPPQPMQAPPQQQQPPPPPQQQQPAPPQQHYQQQQYSMAHPHAPADWGDYMGPAGHPQQYYPQAGPPQSVVRSAPGPPSVYGPAAPML